MPQGRRAARPLALLVLALGASGCLPQGPAASGSVRLTIYAAASLGPVLAACARAYAADHSGTAVTVSTDSSAALETKLEQGAPVDLFLSADVANAERLVQAGLAGGSVVPFATNHLAVIVPLGNPAGIRSPADLARRGVKIVAAGPQVPITGYAEELVAGLARQPGYPPNFVAAYHANVVSQETDVAAVLVKIELGEGDAAIVYATDTRSTGRVEVVAVPPAVEVAARYAGVVVRGSANGEAAAAFLAWLAGPGGQAVMGTFGFSPP